MPLTIQSSNITPPLQGFAFANQQGPGQLFNVGTAFYYVTIQQVGNSPSNILSVYKSADVLTWTLAAQLPAAGPGLSNVNVQDAPCILIGSKIYVIGILVNSGFSPVHCNLQLHIFDTATDTFTSSSLGDNQSGAAQQLWALSARNDGKILITSTVGPAAFSPAFKYQIYDPGLNTWAAAVVIVADASHVLQQAHDPITNNTYIFYITPANAMRCFTLDTTLTSNNQQVLAASFFPVGNIGTSIVSAATGEVVFLYRKFTGGISTLFAIRSTTAFPPVFTIDTVENSATLPGTQVQQYDQIASGGWFPIDLSGTLYAFYAMDNGELDSGSSESWIYYRTSSGPGVWSAPVLAYTAPVPTELLTPYGASGGGFDAVVMLGLINPTTWPAFASLSNVVLFASSAPAAPTTAYINAQGLGVVVLPDPSKFNCN